MTLSRNLSTLGQAVSVSGNIPSANVSGLAAVATSGSASDISTGTLPSAVYTVGDTGVPVLNVYTSSGTWTKAAGLKAIKVTVVGGGGNGGTINFPGNTMGYGASAGGGAAGISIRIYPAPTLPGPQPYTVGAAAGSSSFGVAPVTVIAATGGSVAPTVTTGPGGYASGGAGGTASGGQINIPGSSGGFSIYTIPSTNSTRTGNGGSNMYGGGAIGFDYSYNPASPPSGNSTTIGNSGGGFGSGGSGSGFSVGSGGSFPKPVVNTSGGAGASGVVIVEEFY